MPKIKNVFKWVNWREKQIYPKKLNYYYSEDNFQEYQDLVTSTWSIQFVDTTKRFTFTNACYIWNRIAIDFNGSSMRKINLDTLTVTSSTSSWVSGVVWYFWQDRILTRSWLLDTDWNTITSFSYDSITPWVSWVVWANSWYDIYKGIVNWDNITFTKVWTSWTDQGSGQISYWHLGAYLFNSNDTQWSWCSAYVNPETDAVTTCISGWDSSRSSWWYSWPDEKMYRWAFRYNWWGRFQKVWTANDWFVWNSLSTWWLAYWDRHWHLLGNFVSWWMNGSNGTWTWYWSNSYFIDTSWNITLSQSNAFAYSTSVIWRLWFVDENWWLYPYTSWGWTWVILKTDKTFDGNFPWWNPYLWR